MHTKHFPFVRCLGFAVLALASFLPVHAQDGSSVQQAFQTARTAVAPSLQTKVVSVYGLGTPEAIQKWYIIFYDPSVPSHGRAVLVEDGKITRSYPAQGGTTYHSSLTFDPSRITSEQPALSAAQAYASRHNIAYNGVWGYHPFVLTLANTGEVLGLVNRPANRPSHEGAAAEVDRALAVCFRGGFPSALLRGDTDFSQTEHLDRWNADARIRFIFGYDATPSLKARAEDLPERAWKPLTRPAKYAVQTEPRTSPERVKEQVVVEREFRNIKLVSEDVAEFHYQPTACKVLYRMVVVRKNLSVEKGEKVLFEDVRYFFYITNERVPEPAEIVFLANDRCHQENLLAQLKGGVRGLRAPLDNLMSNWAFMVMVVLAWDLKAWWALRLPESPGRWQERHRREKRWVLGLEFKTFIQAFVRLPCQIVRTGRRLVYRLLSWNRHLPIFFRLLSRLRC